jgi:hypothetical protein
MSATCPLCQGRLESTVVSGIVSLKRRRSFFASGRISPLRGETCVDCGHTRLFAEKLDRLFSDIRPKRTT